MRPRDSRAIGLMGAVALAATLVIAAPVGAASPAGDNGTVKIDGLDFDSHPNNEPHVGCRFEVDFYGFDEGDLWADIEFEAKPPSGTGLFQVDRVFIGEDDHSGGGSGAGLDASAEYELDLSAFTAHPVQGYHVKLTIRADGARGADTKHKTFWVTDCEPTEPPTDPEEPYPNQDT